VYFLPSDTEEAPEPARRRVFCEADAIQTDGSGASFVWTVDQQDRMRRVDVTLGPARDNRIEITSGLSGDEDVVIGPQGLQAGQLVNRN
jgi:multidrug efflux pump subunit AcrA (membrane-fusion protein)